MDTQVRTPQSVFMHPQRLSVPLFQRPYVWNQENQWEPLWNDVIRVAERLLRFPADRHQPHFLGAVVLQQTANPIGSMQTWTIIDGQQRLTTLQLLLDALHAELLVVQAVKPAARIEPLINNAEAFCLQREDRMKVWPTNRDRNAFVAVMFAEPPVRHDELEHQGHRMVEAHRYFSEQSRNWLVASDPEALLRKAEAIERVTRELLQLVVIDLSADENAQEIFETLNARGTPLTAADLIKNFVFQRLLDGGADVESAYRQQWSEFETGFWEQEISVGRVKHQRSSVFLNHWLIARTGEQIVAREVFSRFKRFVTHDVVSSMATLLTGIHEAALVYRQFVISASIQTGEIERDGLFAYRTSVLESEVIKPFVLFLCDPAESAISDGQRQRALEAIESWMVRRMLVRATTKSYTQVVADLITLVRSTDRERAGELVETYLSRQSGGNLYWPDDDELRAEVETLPAYRRLPRGRLRMILEAIEDHLRGWTDGKQAIGSPRIARKQYAIEHIMPRKWGPHWPLSGGTSEEQRDEDVHTIGNLTLLTGKLNSKVSNGPWSGPNGKLMALNKHDTFFLNRELVKTAGDNWTDDSIQNRTRTMIEAIIDIWPVPVGHRSGHHQKRQTSKKRIHLSDLIAVGALESGMSLFPRRLEFSDRIVIVLDDGSVDVDGQPFGSPSKAATSIAGVSTNGWWFFLVDRGTKRSLQNVRRDYIIAMAVDTDEEDDEEDD